MSNTPADNTSKAGLRDALIPHLTASLLPGDTPLSENAMREVADFLVTTGHERDAARSALLLESSTTGKRRLRIGIVNDDMPFLVDSVAAAITALGLSIDVLVHPVVPVVRDACGRLTGIGGDDAQRESMIYIETPRVDARQRRDLLAQLRVTLGDVRAAVTDWPHLSETMKRDARTLEEQASGNPSEQVALLSWLNDGMLTQLGHLTRSRSGEVSEELGICRKSARELLADASFDRAFEWFGQTDENGTQRTLLIIKANRLSTVHRRTALDLFIVPRFNNGEVVALSVHAGVWTSAALATPPENVPMLRAQVAAISQEFGFDANSHAGKALVHAFTSLPHDLLVAFSVADARVLTTSMMSLVDRPRPRLVLVNSPLERHIFAFVWLPRDMLSTSVRLEIQNLLTQLPGSVVLDWSLEVEGGALAMLQFLLDSRATTQIPDARAIEKQLEDLLRGWGEAVEAALSDAEEGTRAAAIAVRYADAFPQSYRAHYGAVEAANDITRLRALAADAGRTSDMRDARLFRLETDPADCLRLKVYHTGGELALSDAVPALENFGFRVLTELATSLAGGALGTIHDFTLEAPAGADAAAILERAETIEAAIAAVLNGAAEDDAFNRLVIDTALTAREAEWLRSFYRYLRQTGMGFTIYTVVDALAGAPDVTRAMIELFTARHDPAFEGDRDAAIKSAIAGFNRGLAQVSAINDDRLLRLYRAVVDATLRTNAFAPAAAEALAFKIDSSLMPALPKPVPWREIFVYSRRVEGIHLRSGAVARGGLRWSDRRDDFRTEILGLMKAQKVKNAVIVPSGAKGGFYPKQLPNPAIDRDGWAAEGQASYEVFIRTLLSVTDNIVEGKVVHPESVRILDGEDPYFVVAADKGTARFSDVANGIAQSRDFWLDDAFASGGSNGYDHKAMGITAKGAWVSVQRHFLEMGIDVQADSVRVAGCGDMSGDVFGNGMLLSKAIKLVAAFDHRHIFVDPEPDPAKSWDERKRMFDLPRSSWEDYDASLISEGGGVYPRSAKKIELSDEAVAMLGLDSAEIEPDALISAILKAQVDLVWFGGIGTYIKAAHESHADCGDPANDALRIDAAEVGAKVVGEGANLGVTQAGRIAFALKGGRINTDFIDNSAGVDCSDNEVNIKIALAAARRAGELSEEDRNALLEAMTDEVSDIVLEDNRLQALALSIAEAGGPEAVPSHVRLIERLEESGDLDRKTEGLSESETFTRRAAEGQGFMRPELAVLLSSAKLALQEAIEASGMPDDPQLESNLIAMFPAPMQERFVGHIREHRLRRELIATDLANRIVNRLGLVHAFELAEEEGAGLADVAAAFIVVERLFDLKTLWQDIDAAPMPEAARLMLFERLAAGVGNLMSDVLRTSAGQVEAADMIRELQAGVSELTRAREELISQETRDRGNALHSRFMEQGAPAELAERVSNLYDLDGTIGLAMLALRTEIAPQDLTRAFTDVGERLGLDWAQGTAAYMSPSDIWERLLVSGLARDFQQMRLEYLRRMMRKDAAKSDPLGTVAAWAKRHESAVAQFRSMVERAQLHQPIAPAVLAQIASQARNLLER
ncbi:MAG: NAD-glutamate dehydrogenase [Pseudomonadota bacterium]|nr:NAD-glutamate dehydrogenase [Pseudomonadota bacterium]